MGLPNPLRPLIKLLRRLNDKDIIIINKYKGEENSNVDKENDIKNNINKSSDNISNIISDNNI